MDRSDFVIDLDEADFPRILQRWWGWLLTEPCTPVLVTSLGDWFLKGDSGRVDFLDTLEGKVSTVASSMDGLNFMLSDQEVRDQYFLSGFVIAMLRAGFRRHRGQCYGYKVHPILGAKVDAENLTLTDIEFAQSMSGQLHQQIRHLTPGTQIAGLDSVGGLEIRLRTLPGPSSS
jgi:hypothetical protein